MGWNTVDVKKQNPILQTNQFNKFYFVHSYYFKCNNNSDILSTTLYSKEFVSSVSKKISMTFNFIQKKS